MALGVGRAQAGRGALVSGMVVSLVGDMGGSPAGGRGEEPVWAALAVCVAPVVWAGAAAGTGFRQAAALIRAVALGNVTVIHGVHLPDRIWGPSFCRVFPARREILATWMARSSFSARSGRTKGFSA